MADSRKRRAAAVSGLPSMEALAEEVGETVLLTRRAGDLLVCVDAAESGPRAVRISYERGPRCRSMPGPPHCFVAPVRRRGASGRRLDDIVIAQLGCHGVVEDDGCRGRRG